MSEDRRRILEMLSTGKITAAEAEQLLDALEMKSQEDGTSEVNPGDKPTLKYLKVEIDGSNGRHERVNIRVPLKMLRAGVRLATLIPGPAREKVNAAFHRKGINLSELKPENLNEIIECLGDLNMDIDTQGEKVRIFCE